MSYRTYVRNNGDHGLILIVFDEGGDAVFAFDEGGAFYTRLYWRDDSAFERAPHFTRYDS